MPRRLAAPTRLALLLPLLAACTAAHTVCRTELPLEERDYLILAPVSINGTAVPGIFDTGAEASAVTADAVTRLGLLGDPRYEAVMSGVGGESTAQSPVLIDSFSLAGFDPNEVHYPVVSIPIQSPKDRPDAQPLGALIGADMIGHFDVDLDVAHRRAVLYDPDHCQQSLPDWQQPVVEVPLNTWNQRLSLTVKVDGQAFRALLDTGASSTVLDLPAAEKLGITAEMLAHEPGGDGFGAAGVNFRHVEYTFKTFELGGERYEHPKLSVLDRPLQDTDMLVGLDWLRLHRVWISYHQHKLLIARPVAVASGG